LRAFRLGPVRAHAGGGRDPAREFWPVLHLLFALLPLPPGDCHGRGQGRGGARAGRGGRNPMNRRTVVAAFAGEADLLRAVAGARKRGWPVVEVYSPYAVPELDRAMGLPRPRLAAACFFCGLFGAGLALAFQFWATAWSWPLNVGGQPWNSLPAFVPVTFE